MNRLVAADAEGSRNVERRPVGLNFQQDSSGQDGSGRDVFKQLQGDNFLKFSTRMTRGEAAAGSAAEGTNLQERGSVSGAMASRAWSGKSADLRASRRVDVPKDRQ